MNAVLKLMPAWVWAALAGLLLAAVVGGAQEIRVSLLHKQLQAEQSGRLEDAGKLGACRETRSTLLVQVSEQNQAMADLRQAEVNSRNLMVEKYARMDDRLPPLSTSPLLDEIADAEEAFLHEAQTRYPHVIKSNGQGMFRRYLRCELETLSDRSLELYAAQVRRAQQQGRNLVVERHDFLMRLLGKGGIEACEAAAQGK